MIRNQLDEGEGPIPERVNSMWKDPGMGGNMDCSGNWKEFKRGP